MHSSSNRSLEVDVFHSECYMRADVITFWLFNYLESIRSIIQPEGE